MLGDENDRTPNIKDQELMWKQPSGGAQKGPFLAILGGTENGGVALHIFESDRSLRYYMGALPDAMEGPVPITSSLLQVVRGPYSP